MNRAGSITRDADRTAAQIFADRCVRVGCVPDDVAPRAQGRPLPFAGKEFRLPLPLPLAVLVRPRRGWRLPRLVTAPRRAPQRVRYLPPPQRPVFRPAKASRMPSARMAVTGFPAWSPAALKTTHGGECVCPSVVPASLDTSNLETSARIARCPAALRVAHADGSSSIPTSSMPRARHASAHPPDRRTCLERGVSCRVPDLGAGGGGMPAVLAVFLRGLVDGGGAAGPGGPVAAEAACGGGERGSHRPAGGSSPSPRAWVRGSFLGVLSPGRLPCAIRRRTGPVVSSPWPPPSVLLAGLLDAREDRQDRGGPGVLVPSRRGGMGSPRREGGGAAWAGCNGGSSQPRPAREGGAT